MHAPICAVTIPRVYRRPGGLRSLLAHILRPPGHIKKKCADRRLRSAGQHTGRVGIFLSLLFRHCLTGRKKQDGVTSVLGKLLESVLDSVVGHHFLFEDISACFRRFLHYDDFAESTSFTFLKRRDGFLCHGSVVLILFLYEWSFS